MKELDLLIEKIKKFRDEREWAKYHNPKDIAISIAIEAGELLENFQWKDNDEALSQKKQEIIDEMADVFIYLLLLSDSLSVDIIDAAIKKVDKNSAKYPVSKVYGDYKKYTEIEES